MPLFFKIQILFFLCIFSISCNTIKNGNTIIQPNEIIDVQYFEPISYISLIENGNKGFYNKEISRKAENVLSNCTNQFHDKIHLTDNIIINDSILKSRYIKEINELIAVGIKNRGLIEYPIPHLLDSLLDSRNKRFGLITFSIGFTRTKENYINQNLEGAGMALLTLGTFYQIPIKTNSTVYVIITDAKENNIAFYKKYTQSQDPLNENVIHSQLYMIFSKFFYKRNKFNQ